MHVTCGASGFDERSHGARRDRDVGCARRVEDAQGVVDDLCERGVARDARDAEHVEARMAHREQDREGVVDPGVDVEDHGNAHRITVAPPRREPPREVAVAAEAALGVDRRLDARGPGHVGLRVGTRVADPRSARNVPKVRSDARRRARPEGIERPLRGSGRAGHGQRARAHDVPLAHRARDGGPCRGRSERSAEHPEREPHDGLPLG